MEIMFEKDENGKFLNTCPNRLAANIRNDRKAEYKLTNNSVSLSSSSFMRLAYEEHQKAADDVETSSLN